MRGALLWALSDPYLDLPGARRVGPGISVCDCLPRGTRASAAAAPSADCLPGRVPPRSRGPAAVAEIDSAAAAPSADCLTGRVPPRSRGPAAVAEIDDLTMTFCLC